MKPGLTVVDDDGRSVMPHLTERASKHMSLRKTKIFELNPFYYLTNTVFR